MDIVGVISKTNSKIIANLDWDLYVQNHKSSKEIENSEKGNFGYNAPNDKIYRITKKHELKDFLNNQVLINEKFDTLYQENNFIIGLKNKEYKIYNLKLESIAPFNTRSAFPTKDYGCQILVNNKVKWLTEYGYLSNEPKKHEFLVCGTVTTINKEIKYEENSLQLYESTDAFDDKEPEKQVFTFSQVNFDDIWFLNGTKSLTYDDNTGINANYHSPLEVNNILIIENKNQYGLALHNEQKKELIIIETPSYDSIMVENYYHPILLKKDGLYGYYLLNKKLRYKSISKFNFSFARFTLPNGREGWLDIMGNEYLDN